MSAARSVWLRSAASLWLVMLACLMPLLVSLGYAAWQWETLVSAAATALASLVAALLLHGRPRLRDACLAFLVYWLIDTFVPDGTVGPVAGLLLAAATFAGLRSRHSDSVRSMLLAFSGVWLLGAYMGTSTPHLNPALVSGTAPGSDKPPIIHIVLDEQMSPRTLPQTLPTGHPAQRIIDDYLARGFDVYSHAASQSSNTHVSLSALLLMDEGKNYKSAKGKGFTYKVLDNRYHTQLQKEGYAVRIMQSNYLQICSEGAGFDCHTYTRGNNGDAMRHFPDHLATRLALMLQEIHGAYLGNKVGSVTLYREVLKLLDKAGWIQLDNAMFFTRPTLMLNLFDEIRPQLTEAKPGEAYFLHFLLPHFPYMLDAQCRLKPAAEWSAPNRYSRKPRDEASIYAAYWDQSACAHRQVMALIDAVSSRPGVRPVIYIHGDHGSRITGKETAGQGPDMLETFMAVRDRRSQGQEHRQEEELQGLFSRLFQQIDRRQ